MHIRIIAAKAHWAISLAVSCLKTCFHCWQQLGLRGCPYYYQRLSGLTVLPTYTYFSGHCYSLASPWNKCRPRITKWTAKKKNSSHKEIWYAHNLQSLLHMAQQAWTKFFMNVLYAWSLPQPLCIISGIYEDHTRVIFSFVPVTRKWKSKQTTGSWVGPRNESKSSLLWLFFTWTLLSGSNPSLSFLTDDKCTWMFDLYVDVHKQASKHAHTCLQYNHACVGLAQAHPNRQLHHTCFRNKNDIFKWNGNLPVMNVARFSHTSSAFCT